MLKKIPIFICSIFLIIMTFITTINVLLRYAFNFSFAWAPELTRYLFIWVSFLGATYVLTQKKHLTMDALLQRLSIKVREFIEVFHSIIIIFFLTAIVIFGFRMAKISSNVTSPAMQISMVYIYLALPISSLIMLGYIIREMLTKKDLLRRKK